MKRMDYDQFQSILSVYPAYRQEQVLRWVMSPGFDTWQSMKNIPAGLIADLDRMLACSPYGRDVLVQSSKTEEVHKAALTLHDGRQIETVLMRNPKGHLTVCSSTQVGCAMRCQFCATGKMGFIRQLDPFEMALQIPFWQKFIAKTYEKPVKITNIVLMGMGEPLLNYETVKQVIHWWIRFSEVGPNKITVSTVGILPAMEKLLSDPSWPPVKIAISLHAGTDDVRKSIVPSHTPKFFADLGQWITKYHTLLGNRNRPLTFEYVLLCDVNDRKADAIALAGKLKAFHRVKINLIPWNPIQNAQYSVYPVNRAVAFQKELKSRGLMCTIRRTMGRDIDAACGQLIKHNSPVAG